VHKQPKSKRCSRRVIPSHGVPTSSSLAMEGPARPAADSIVDSCIRGPESFNNPALALRREVSGVTSTARDSSLASFPDNRRPTTCQPLRASALFKPVIKPIIQARDFRLAFRSPTGAATAEARGPDAVEESRIRLVLFLLFPDLVGPVLTSDTGRVAADTGGAGATYPGVPGPPGAFHTPNPEYTLVSS
jgi:hypothetical protein